MKFRIGDKVRLNKNKKEFKYRRGPISYDEIGTIETVDKDEYVVNFPSHSCWNGKENELELVTTTFTKSDLKDGDKCTLKNGQTVFYGSKDYRNIYCFENLTDDFKYELNDEVSIVKVERPKYETVFERKEEILDNTEKNYLRGVIRPFRDRVKTIEKNIMDDMDNGEYISINFEDFLDSFSLPIFKKETMYKGMKLNKEYTLEELGL